ncbi:MAG: hydrogenase maturation protease [Acidimicrobiia bacterium]|nr:hydrogenase maturation protease [Acidimicrobiia bacterium]
MRLLVAGVGNIFNGDDGFGSEVAQRLQLAGVPEGVEVVDIGIRGVHLAYQLLDGYDLLILVDVVDRGEPPGTVVVLEPELDAGAAPPMDAHRMDPAAVLGMLDDLGGSVERLVVVGCQPADLGEGIGLSPPVAAAVDVAADAVRELVQEQMVLIGEA